LNNTINVELFSAAIGTDGGSLTFDMIKSAPLQTRSVNHVESSLLKEWLII